MEKHKTEKIVLGAGAFLILIVAIAFLLNNPETQTPPKTCESGKILCSDNICKVACGCSADVKVCPDGTLLPVVS